MRRVSKYDLDRGVINFKQLKKEKEKDMTDNVKIKRQELEEQVVIQKKEEVQETMHKINAL